MVMALSVSMFASLRTLIYDFTRFYRAVPSGSPSASAEVVRQGLSGRVPALGSHPGWLRGAELRVRALLRRLGFLVCRICPGAVLLRALKDMGKAADDVALFNSVVYDGFFIELMQIKRLC